jgi:hypothetical protein
MNTGFRRADLPPEKRIAGYAIFRSACPRGDVTGSGVDPPPIAIARDIPEQAAPRGLAIGTVALVDELGSRAPKKLSRPAGSSRAAVDAVCGRVSSIGGKQRVPTGR